MAGDRDDRAIAAHVLRRTSFGPFPGGVDAALDRHGTPAGLLDAIIDAEPLPFEAPPGIDEPFDVDDEATGNRALQAAWIRRLMRDDAGLHDKMMWFWHGHFTSSLTKASGLWCWRQLRTLHRHALGNFGDLTKAMLVDGAMLMWLDGAASQRERPNENLARELMELFTMGRGTYTEDDVRATALALAGWDIDDQLPTPIGPDGPAVEVPLTILGRTRVFTVDDVVDNILDQPSTAPFVVGRLAREFFGPTVDDDLVASWARSFRASGYELAPLVEEIVRSDALAQARLGRHRRGMEWLCVVLRVLGGPIPDDWRVLKWGQMPYQPPNVAGWPDRWGSPSSYIARAAFLHDHQPDPDVVGDLGDDPVEAALERCGLYEASATTRRALADLAADDDDPGVLLRGALLSPELQLA